ncbi:ABC transporter permease [Nocardioides sediminis]|uniref:ABC transporter permease n=1 Tax=Nocardioides sediminis TaxID=433648 RepID=UPI000D323A9E|nr:ABC antibiotics transporter [Nocardioides sediminis]
MRAPTTADLTGTRRLVRLAARRDRWTLPGWWLGLGFFVAATTALFADSFARGGDLVEETRLVATNTGMRLIGLTSGPSVGGYMLHREFVTLAVLAALMGSFAVIRHTRQNEELGRAELVGSTVVGRYAGLAAGVVIAVVAEVVLALVLAAGMVAAGLPVAGSLLAGASVASVGLVWVGVAAVTCQLSSTARGAAGIAAAALGIAFGLSGIGNMLGTVDRLGLRVTSAWPSWLSPIGWGQQTRPFGDARWWPLLLALLALAALVAVAVVLAARRDVGRGLWPERTGPAGAARTLLSPAGLVWRLQRNVSAGWALSLAMFGLVFGNLTEQIRGLEGSARDWWIEAGGTDVIVEAYQVSIIQMAGMFVAIHLVQLLLRMRVDEVGGTLEPLLATGVTRTRWLGAHLAVAVTSSVALMVLFAVAMGLTTGQVLGDTGAHVRALVGAGLVQVPGILVVGAAVTAVVCVVPRWSVPISWSILLATLVVGPMFGPGLDLPAWLQDTSPFTHSPKAPAAAVTAAPLLGLTAVSLGLAAAALVSLRRRTLSLPA